MGMIAGRSQYVDSRSGNRNIAATVCLRIQVVGDVSRRHRNDSGVCGRIGRGGLRPAVASGSDTDRSPGGGRLDALLQQ